MITMLFTMLAGGIAIILFSIPLYLQKIGHNGWYGFRVKKTIENPDLWYPVNKYFSGWLMLAGVVTILAALGLFFVPGLGLDTYSIACAVIFTVVFAVAVTMTTKYMNSL